MPRTLIVVTILVVSTLFFATARSAAADRVVLHSKDSITIDGTGYSCDDPSGTGVQLALGDHLTVGEHQIKCKGDGHPASTVAVESRVDASCISNLDQTISGSPSAAEAIRWADACRPFEIGKQCTMTSSAPDDDCYSALNQVISGSFSDPDALRAQHSCQRMQATCPALPTAAESTVDLDCVDRMYQSMSGKPDGHAILGWLESCRSRPVGTCVVVSGTLDPACVSRAHGMISGNFSPGDAATASRACRTLELRCP